MLAGVEAGEMPLKATNPSQSLWRGDYHDYHDGDHGDEDDDDDKQPHFLLTIPPQTST